MRKSIIHLSAFILLFSGGGLALSSCKEKKKTEVVTDPVSPTVVTPPTTPAPVVINPDDSLSGMVTDATKDFPTVKTSVSDGVITLTGEINKENLMTLMQSLQQLRPKKIENKLTIK